MLSLKNNKSLCGTRFSRKSIYETVQLLICSTYFIVSVIFEKSHVEAMSSKRWIRQLAALICVLWWVRLLESLKLATQLIGPPVLFHLQNKCVWIWFLLVICLWVWGSLWKRNQKESKKTRWAFTNQQGLVKCQCLCESIFITGKDYEKELYINISTVKKVERLVGKWPYPYIYTLLLWQSIHVEQNVFLLIHYTSVCSEVAA